MKVQLIGGISTNFLVNNRVNAVTNTGVLPMGKVEDIRTMNYSGNAGISFIYPVLDDLNISLEPRFKYYINSINLENLPPTHPYSFGLFAGLNYTF